MSDQECTLSFLSQDQRTPQKSRGPYRSNRRTPRQTLHNRKKLKLSANRQSLETEPWPAAAGTACELLRADTSEYQTSQVADDDNSFADFSSSSVNEAPDDVPGSVPESQCPKQPLLFPGSLLRSDVSHLLISSFFCRHHLSNQAQEDLLLLLKLHLPSDSQVPSSLYSFRKISEGSSLEPTTHSYCPRCYTPLSSGELTVCPNQCCCYSLSTEATPSFVCLSIGEQLKTLLKRPGVFQSLQLRRDTPRKPGRYADVCDGLLYQALASKGGPLADDYSISVVLNTDGVEVFHSSRLSLWPVLLMINELPFAERRQPKNMLLAGLWCSEIKPPMHLFLQPITEMLSELESTGVEVHLGNEAPLQMKVCVLCCSCDLPARAIVQNFIQFNGYYGCCFCEQPGETTHTEKGGHVHTFPYNHISPKGPPRTQQATIQKAREALEEHSVVAGVKGPCSLGCLKSFDLIKGMSPDYMHCALLGVSKMLLHLWTDTSRCRGTLHNLHADVALLDRRIKDIEVPSEIHRKPRGISDLKQWKASEYRAWTLFYAIPVLRGFLHEDYFQHFLLFSEALWLLLQSAPSEEDVDTAERLLQHFCLKFAAYYGQRHCTANVHQLLHFADSVRNIGPLWAHSTFPFEDANGWLIDLFHGSRDPQRQIMKGFIERQRLSAAVDALDDDRAEFKGFLHQMLTTGHRYSVTVDAGNGHLILGKISRGCDLSDVEEAAVFKQFPSANLKDCMVYNRILISGVIYTATSYRRSSTTNDHLVCIKHGSNKAIGSAVKYLSFCTKECLSCSKCCYHIILVDIHHILQSNLSTDTITKATARHVHQITHPSGIIEAYQTDSIITKCVLVKISGSELYAVELPNYEESNL